MGPANGQGAESGSLHIRGVNFALTPKQTPCLDAEFNGDNDTAINHGPIP